jgi:C_GCAxxG_C_C family probable redox protein
MREVCGAVSGMCMIAGLETGTSREGDAEGKKHNYEVVQNLAEEFRKGTGSIICRELLGLDGQQPHNVQPDQRTPEYYQKRPCVQLVKDAAGILNRFLCEVSFIPVETKEQIKETAAIAETVWHEHYASILKITQIDYMLEKFQSCDAITEQISKDGYQYYELVNQGGAAGYFSFRKQADSLFLSKLYIVKEYRGRDYARKTIDFLSKICNKEKLSKIWLTVNRNNLNSIAAYEKLGFIKARTQVTDIGSGYVMDDYVMELIL